MASRVQFREDEEVVAYVERQGYNPNEFARQAFEEAVRRLRAEDRARRLREAEIELPGSTAEAVREDREGR